MGQVAAEENSRLYLVGGLIRDKLLGRQSLDIDLACNGPAKKLASRLARELGVDFHYHSTFRTAHLEGPKGTRIDIAMTRTETYPIPGELPKVKKAVIAQDLYRRDFTINAMAQTLHPGEFGTVIDPLNGRADLKKGLIRVIHDASFTDDPTRIFRAVRYEHRIEGSIEPHTAELMARAIQRIKYLSGERLLYELRCIMAEEKEVRLKVVEKLMKLGALDFLGKPIAPLSPARTARLKTEKSCEFLCLLFSHFEEKKVKKLPVKKACLETVATVRAKKEIWTRLACLSIPSRITFFLNSHDARGLRILAEVQKDRSADKIATYLEEYRSISIKTTGDDLVRMGLEPGPGYRKLLEKLLAAKIDGKIRTKAEEQKFLKTLLRR